MEIAFPNLVLQYFQNISMLWKKSNFIMIMIINLYSANSIWHVQMRFTISRAWDPTESIESATGCRYTIHVWSLISVVERLDQRLNLPTQGQTVARTGTNPFSLTAPGSDPRYQIPSRESNPGRIGERPTLTTRPPEHQFFQSVQLLLATVGYLDKYNTSFMAKLWGLLRVLY